MIITLHRAIVVLPSVDGGRGRLALVLVDPLGDRRLSSSSSMPDGQVGVVGLVDVTRRPRAAEALAGRSSRVTRWRRTSSVMRRVCSSSTIGLGRAPRTG